MSRNFTAAVRSYLNAVRRTDLSKSFALSEADIDTFANVVASEKDVHLKLNAQELINGLKEQLDGLQKQNNSLNALRTVLGDTSATQSTLDSNSNLQLRIASDMAWYLTSSARLKSLRSDVDPDHEIWGVLNPFTDLRPPMQIVRSIHNKEETDSFDSGTTSVHETIFNQALYARLLSRSGIPRRADPTIANPEPIPFDPDRVTWEKGKEIGHGAFGTVSAVFCPSSKTVLVVKEIHLLSLNQRLRKQVRRECDILQSARHPNIVALAAIRDTDEVVEIFMEYVSGGTIAGIIKHTGPLAEAEARPIMRQVLAGLVFLHDRSIAHRDIKGANILVDLSGCVKLGDLGSAKLLDDVQYDQYHTLKPSVAGTIFWMAPEILHGAVNYSTLVDIWSVGCLILEMLSGKHPWYREPGPGLAAVIPENVVFRVGEGETPPLPSNASDGAITMFSRIFVEADQRISAQDLQRDPWMMF